MSEPYTEHVFKAAVTQPVKVFYSYAHIDEPFCVELDKHLSLMRREGAIASWHDRHISAGTEWKDCIDKNLAEADIILLLVSADYLHSDYCRYELERAMDLHAKAQARVIPVILRQCDWLQSSFGKLQALPRNATPITQWPNPDDAYLDVVSGIRDAVASLSRGNRITRRRNFIVAALIAALLVGFAYLWRRGFQSENATSPTMMVSGFVLGSDGNGIEGAQVTVEGLPVLQTATGTSGKFTIDFVPGKPGDKVFLIVSKDGYTRSREPYVLNDTPKEILLGKQK